MTPTENPIMVHRYTRCILLYAYEPKKYLWEEGVSEFELTTKKDTFLLMSFLILRCF